MVGHYPAAILVCGEQCSSLKQFASSAATAENHKFLIANSLWQQAAEDCCLISGPQYWEGIGVDGNY